MNEYVVNIPISRIRVANPRHRDKKKFAAVVESIRNVGLKKPIKVALRQSKDEQEPSYDLICGQGRKEAFEVLGYTEIPALVVEANREEGMLMSLVENMARRVPSTFELINEVVRLKEGGYSNAAIARKLDITKNLVAGMIILNEAGEERLVFETMRGQIPIGTAIEIAKIDGPEKQREFLDAYEKGHLNLASIRTVRRVLAQRNAFSKKLGSGAAGANSRNPDKVLDTLKKESQRQKALIRKAQICEARVLFIVGAFQKLVRDEDFLTPLRAEGVESLPKELSDKLTMTS